MVNTKFKLYAYVNYLSNLEAKYVFYMYKLPGSDVAHHMGKTNLGIEFFSCFLVRDSGIQEDIRFSFLKFVLYITF